MTAPRQEQEEQGQGGLQEHEGQEEYEGWRSWRGRRRIIGDFCFPNTIVEGQEWGGGMFGCVAFVGWVV